MIRWLSSSCVRFLIRKSSVPAYVSLQNGEGQSHEAAAIRDHSSGIVRNVIFAGCVIAAVSRFDLADIKNTHAQPIEDRATEIRESISEAASAAGPMTDIAQGSLREFSRPEATFAEIAAASMADFVRADAGESLSPAEAPDESFPIRRSPKPSSCRSRRR